MTQYFEAEAAVQEEGKTEVPIHLRDASYKGAKRLGHGKGYEYPHDFPGHHVAQQYLPDALVGRRFYEPSEEGYEREVKESVERWRTGTSGEASSRPSD